MFVDWSKLRPFEPLSYQIAMEDPNVLKLDTPDASNQQSKPGIEDKLIPGLENL